MRSGCIILGVPVELQQSHLSLAQLACILIISSPRARMPTISSLHIGHTSLLEALAAAAFSVLASRTLLPISSLVSVVLAGLTEVCELRDSELSEGDSKLTLRLWWWWGGRGCGETAGERLCPVHVRRPGTCPRSC
jgi:hypothetical protein